MAITSPLATQKASEGEEPIWCRTHKVREIGLRQEHLSEGLQECTGLWRPAEVPELEAGG